MNKRIVSLFLVLVMLLSLQLPVSAVGEGEYLQQAEILKSLGLFLGTDAGFELERAATRAEAAVMMVRLLGKEAAAKSESPAHPFTDVPEWAGPYVGYLYQNGITRGVAADRFGAAEAATAAQYATYVLRALGYDDAAGDFSWDKSLEKMLALGIITSAEAAAFGASGAIPRGHVAAISYLSLFASLKDKEQYLLDRLYNVEKAISFEQIKAAVSDKRIAAVAGKYGVPSPLPQAPVLTSEEIFITASDAVFKIDLSMVDTEDAYGGSGSGFFISPDGIAVTNFHVISNAVSATVMTTDGKQHEIEGVLGFDPINDLALIKVAGSGFPYLSLGDPAALRAAQRIYCIGSPGGFDNTISDGLVSNLNRQVDDVSYIQISAPVTYGSSGGALLNEYGQVVGVTTLIYGDGSQGLNLAVPITRLADNLRFEEMRSFKYFKAHVRYGVVPFGQTQPETGGDDEQAYQSLANDGLLYGTIADAADVDYYTVEVDSRSELVVSITSDALHAGGLSFEVIHAGSSKVIYSSSYYNGEAFSMSAGRIAQPGKYYIRVFAGDETQAWNDVSYELYTYWHALPSDKPIFMVMPEFEPNDSAEYGNYIFQHSMVIGTMKSAADKDYYKFTIDKSENYFSVLSVNADQSALNGEVFDASTGSSAGKFSVQDGATYFDRDLPAGDYYILITAKDKSIQRDNEIYVLVTGPRQ